jgi:hypothetical protein
MQQQQFLQRVPESRRQPIVQGPMMQRIAQPVRQPAVQSRQVMVQNAPHANWRSEARQGFQRQGSSRQAQPASRGGHGHRS